MKTLLLDFDGTVCDSRMAIAKTLATALIELESLECDDAFILEHISYGTGLELTIERILRLNQRSLAKTAEIAQFYRSNYDRIGAKLEKPFPGVPTSLDALSRMVSHLVIVSNKTETAVLEAIQRLDLGGYFSGVIGARENQPKKPDPRLYQLRVAPLAGPLDKDTTLMVGDTRSDAAFAQNLGIPFAWASFGFVANWSEDWPAHDVILEKFEDLVNYGG